MLSVKIAVIRLMNLQAQRWAEAQTCKAEGPHTASTVIRLVQHCSQLTVSTLELPAGSPKPCSVVTEEQ
jgi:hypothetical protein